MSALPSREDSPSPPQSSPDKAPTTARAIHAHFQTYEKSRLVFAQTIADLAAREANIPILQSAGVIALLKPLLADTSPGTKQAAAVAIGRIANDNPELGALVVEAGILRQLVTDLAEQNRFFKKAAAFVLRAVARHSIALAQAVVDSGALIALCACLEEFDPGVKEAASWALGYIARHSAELAQAVVSSGAVPLLVLCNQEPELSLKRISASALSDISKHSPELAQAVVDAHAVPFLTQLITSPDAKLKRQVCSALSQIAKHSIDLAETVVDAEIFPAVLLTLQDVDPLVRKHGATLLCELAKHTPELAQLIVNSGGIAAIVHYITEAEGSNKLPGIMNLGYIAAFGETLAAAVVLGKGVSPLAVALNDKMEHVKAAAAWALGQIGRHSPEHAKMVAEQGVLLKLLQVLVQASEDEVGQDLKMKTKRALKSILEKTLALDTLDPLLQLTTPASIFKYTIAQFAKVLPHDVAARRAFVTSGGLQRVQEFSYALKQVAPNGEENSYGPGSKLYESIKAVNECYPEEIVRYYSPGYSTTLLEKIDSFKAEEQGKLGGRTSASANSKKGSQMYINEKESAVV